MSTEYNLAQKEDRQKYFEEYYKDQRIALGLAVCPHAKMLRHVGMFCPFFSLCSRDDKGKYYECIGRR